jgi:alanine dehydrogenase
MVQILAQKGHNVYVEHDSGLGAGFSDQEFERAGARIVYSAQEVFGRADLVLKFARPLLEEIEWIRPGAALAGFLHLASSRKEKVETLLTKGITAIAYEQIQLPDGSLPLLRPLSQIGGKLTAQIGARLLQNNEGGKGILLGGIAGIPPAEVVVIGAGVLGSCAVEGFYGMGAHVTVLDTNLMVLQRTMESFPGVATLLSNSLNIARVCQFADIVVGAILVAGDRAPIVITRDIVRLMKPRSVIMDISIDQGGCVETSRPTTHEKSTFIEEGIIHYCVPNIPSVVAQTSTYAFLNSAYPYIFEIVDKGIESAVKENPAIEKGLMTHDGKFVNNYSQSIYQMD